MLDKKIIDLLACPVCKGEVEEKENRIVCKECGLKYPIREGIPIMLIAEAER
ncbi:MAG: Trm112 family protein [Candidatus Omnitrophica bacterium]|nr:Trm112 family protein [Candidatus Omnitrophota bacterium]MCM8798640.1 Trm112 family protein [Candidatus Omnitrophota bacterium]